MWDNPQPSAQAREAGDSGTVSVARYAGLRNIGHWPSHIWRCGLDAAQGCAPH